MTTNIRAVLVSVDYADLLEVTLPSNRHHFSDVMVVTSLQDQATRTVALRSGCWTFSTDLFYKGGAVFNKWLALEKALDSFGRRGWLCLMDADILWPKTIDTGFLSGIQPGNLYTPVRRILDVSSPIPPESSWKDLPPFLESEFAGYSQIFHASDPCLGAPPWHQTDWVHAGGADSFFQMKWATSKKVRPPFEVLHLGEPGRNWCGRTGKRRDGTTVPDSETKKRLLQSYLDGRRSRSGEARYSHERLGTTQL